MFSTALMKARNQRFSAQEIYKNYPDALPRHPLCEQFPPLSDEEMWELIVDVKTNGLRQPIALVGGGVLTDGIVISPVSLQGLRPDLRNGGDQAIS